MSDLPECKLCNCDPFVDDDGEYAHPPGSDCVLASAFYMTEAQWRTLMTQQAEPSQVPTGHVYLPEITPEMWETLGDTDVMTWIDGPQWTQIAVDFASMLPVKMPAQHPDKDRLRFKSTCEISGDKHPEYVRGYEAAMDAVCKAQQAGEPVEYQFFDPATGKWHNFMNDQHRRNTADAGYEIRALYTAPQAQPAPIPMSGLSVWLGSMPESNGKRNWTAILHTGDISKGFAVARSEYYDRVRYDADCVRLLIGEIDVKPDIREYDGETTMPPAPGGSDD